MRRRLRDLAPVVDVQRPRPQDAVVRRRSGLDGPLRERAPAYRAPAYRAPAYRAPA